MRKIKQIIPIICFLLVGGVCGFFMGQYLVEMDKNGKSSGEVFLSLALFFVGMYFAIFLQIIIHEGGHLIFGLLTGYRFSSFRVGSLMWIKENGQLRLRRLSLAGTGGQCLMIPPDIVNDEMPHILYFLGGVIFNAVAAVIALGLGILSHDIPVVSLLCMMLAFIGIAFALINGIPMRTGTIDNDGYNAFALGKNKAALHALSFQLKVNEQVVSGTRLKDMPDEWFVVPSAEEMKNSMVAVIGVFTCNRLIDQGKFPEAAQTMEELLQMKSGIAGLHRNLMINDQIYCELMGANNPEYLQTLMTKEMSNFMKSMKQFPSILRTQYAYALLAENDQAKAAKIKTTFDKISKKYPHPAEIIAECELMELAASKHLIMLETAPVHPHN